VPQIPYTQEGFTVSFNLNNLDFKEVQNFYHTYGFAVFDDILKEE
jgi:hypothetical protein